MRLVIALIATVPLWAACGDDKKEGAPKPAEKPADLPALAMPELGVDSVKKMNYVYGDGAKAYAKVAPAYKKQDWPAVIAAAEETLAKDPGHLDAHRYLGAALARTGDFPGATEHLLIALGGDFVRWGAKLPEDPDLTEYLASPHGKALLAKHLEIKAAVERAIGGGLWLVGRRSTFKWPAKSGPASTRGEVYVWDEASRRFFRVTHTSHQVAAWLPSPNGAEIALVGYEKAVMPDPKDAKAAKTAPPTIRAWVESIDARTFETVTARATFKNVRALAAYWGDGGQLLVDTFKPSGRWALAKDATYAIDATTGKAAKSAAAADPASGRALVSLDETLVSGPARGITPTPSATDPGLITGFTFASTGRAITIPESGLGDASVPRANPSGTRAAFATWVDPCGEPDAAKPSLYVADAATGQLKHLLTAASRFNVAWISDDRLAYEDGSGSLRVWDATTGREATKLAEKAGLGLSGLSPSAKPICRQEPLADVETDDGSEPEPAPEPADPLPPEEGAPAEPAKAPE
jgi:hypothetical protein